MPVWFYIILGLVLGFLVFSAIVSGIMFRVLLVRPKFGQENAPLSKQDKKVFF